MENKSAIQSVTYILSGALLQLFNGVDDGWASTLVAIFGFILFYVGLGKLKSGLDAPGQQAVGLLMIAAIIGVAGAFIDLIPLMGIFASLAFVAAFVIELIGFLRLKNSGALNEAGKSGVSLLIAAMALAIVQSLFGFLPFVGGIFAAIFAIAAIVLVFLGWVKIQEDMAERSIVNN